MNIKTLQCRLNITGNSISVVLPSSDMYRAYMFLDLLSDEVIGELFLADPSTKQRLVVRPSNDLKNTPDGDCLLLSADAVDCIKQLIFQCSMNPYDMEWLHDDIESVTANGNHITLSIRLQKDA